MALEEVENALVTLSREKRRTEVLLQAVEANGLAAELAFKRYQAGLESYLAVIDAQNALPPVPGPVGPEPAAERPGSGGPL